MAQQASGTRDIAYDLISVAYHALQGAESANTYIEDAVNEGDPALAEFFRQVRQQYRETANQAQQLLAGRLGAQQ